MRVSGLKSMTGSGTDLVSIGPLERGAWREALSHTLSCLQTRPTFPPSPLTSCSGLEGEDRQERGEQWISTAPCPPPTQTFFSDRILNDCCRQESCQLTAGGWAGGGGLGGASHRSPGLGFGWKTQVSPASMLLQSGPSDSISLSLSAAIQKGRVSWDPGPDLGGPGCRARVWAWGGSRGGVQAMGLQPNMILSHFCCPSFALSY